MCNFLQTRCILQIILTLFYPVNVMLIAHFTTDLTSNCVLTVTGTVTGTVTDNISIASPTLRPTAHYKDSCHTCV